MSVVTCILRKQEPGEDKRGDGISYGEQEMVSMDRSYSNLRGAYDHYPQNPPATGVPRLR